MSRLGEGRWKSCEQLLLEAISWFDQVGDVRRRIECTCLFSTYTHYRGRFAQRVEQGKRVADLGRQSGDLQAQAWGRLDQLESLLNLGRLDESLALEAPLLRDLGQGIIGSDVLMAQGLLASLHRRRGNLVQAAAAAEAALPLMTESPPTIVYNLEACGGVAETFLFLWREARRQGRTSSATQDNARRAVRALTRFSRVFPVGRPRALVCRSEARLLDGDVQGARLDAEEAARAAEHLQMPFEQGCALRQWAATLPTPNPERTRLLERAALQFAGLDARWDHARVLAGFAD